MTLPADVARCPGYQADGEWREGCEDCLRRTAAPIDHQRQYAQLNDTWGVLAPIAQLHAELPQGAMRFTKVRQRELEQAA